MGANLELLLLVVVEDVEQQALNKSDAALWQAGNSRVGHI